MSFNYIAYDDDYWTPSHKTVYSNKAFGKDTEFISMGGVETISLTGLEDDNPEITTSSAYSS